MSARRSSIDLRERLWTILRAASSGSPVGCLFTSSSTVASGLLGSDLVELVDDDADGRELVGGDAVDGQDGREDLARVDLDADVLGGDADGGEEEHDRAEQLHLGGDRRLADDVHVPLVVLALAAALHRLEPPALGDGVPLEREHERGGAVLPSTILRASVGVISVGGSPPPPPCP